MTRTLEERLATLADGETSSTTVSADVLWGRGRRWHRRRREVTALALGCLVMLLGGVGAWGFQGGLAPTLATVSVAGAPGEAVSIPDTVWDPSPWLPTLVDGPVVAIQETDRGSWFGSRPGVAAISAHGGEYGFLGLPDYAEGASLSRDGRRVAYWALGTPTGDPQTAEDQSWSVTAVAVRDLVTGEAWRHDFPTEHGVAPHDLVWLDSATVVSGHGQWLAGDAAPDREQGGVRTEEPWLWDLSQDAPVGWKVGAPAQWLDRAVVTTRAEDALLAVDGEVWWLSSEHDQAKRVKGRYRASGHSGTPVLAWSSDHRLASVGGGAPDTSPNKVQVALLEGPDSVIDWRTVPRSGGTFGVLGWRDGEVVVHSRIRDRSFRTALYTMDSDDGTMTPLVMPSEGARQGDLGLLSSSWQWSIDHLEVAQLVPGVEPPSPVDPRLVAGGATVGVLAILWALVSWRRRGHP